MSGQALETFLAALYTDEAVRERFLAEPESTARAYHLDASEVRALLNVDWPGLALAARSYAKKRQNKARPGIWRHFLRKMGF
jgi:hypothetical protein